MKGKFIIKIDMCSDKRNLIAEFVSLVDDTLTCRNTIFENDDQICHQDVSFKLASINQFSPVNHIDYSYYISNLEKKKNDIIEKEVIEDVFNNKISIENNITLNLNYSDDIYTCDADLISNDNITVNNEEEENVTDLNEEKENINQEKADLLKSLNIPEINDKSNSEHLINDNLSITSYKTDIFLSKSSLLNKIIHFIRSFIEKICFLRFFMRIECIKNESTFPEIAVDFSALYNLDNTEIDKMLKIQLEGTELAVIPKALNIDELFKIIEDKSSLDTKLKQIKNTKDIEINSNKFDPVILEKSKDKNDFLPLYLQEDRLLRLTDKSNNANDQVNISNKKDYLDLPEPTLVKILNSPSFIRYLEEKKLNKKRYIKKLSLKEIRKLDEKSKNINSKGFQYGKQHYLYVSNVRKSTFDKNSVCKYTGKYYDPIYTGQQALYLFNRKESKYPNKSKSNKKYKKNNYILDNEKTSRSPIIISSAKKLELVKKE